jgi:UDPglucose 6-dehydrogenase
MKKIGFIGLGKLGLDCAEVFAEHYETLGFDIYPKISDSVKVVNTPKELVESVDWIFIAVPTPHDAGYDGSVPSSHLEPRDFGHNDVITALQYIRDYAKTPKKVVLISTVLPGTVRKNLVEHLGSEFDHKLFYNPYLIAMGSVKWDMTNPEMIIIGTDQMDAGLAQQLKELYIPLMKNDPRYVTGTWEECESIKIFYNTFISAKIGLVNMIQDFAIKIGNINVDVVTDALANSNIRIMSTKYMTAGLGDSGACHPRDNIALRWLAKEYNLGYDLFDTIMSAREIQAKNLADFLLKIAKKNDLPIVIHGKAYKPDVPYCIGSYSTLIGTFIQAQGWPMVFVDPLADDQQNVVDTVTDPAVILLAHNRNITYGYTNLDQPDRDYYDFVAGSIVVDPWRRYPQKPGLKVIHYGNTRK